MDTFLSMAGEASVRNVETGNGGPFGAVIVNNKTNKVVACSGNSVTSTLYERRAPRSKPSTFLDTRSTRVASHVQCASVPFIGPIWIRSITRIPRPTPRISDSMILSSTKNWISLPPTAVYHSTVSHVMQPNGDFGYGRNLPIRSNTELNNNLSII